MPAHLDEHHEACRRPGCRAADGPPVHHHRLERLTGPNAQLADQLTELAALLRRSKADRFRVRAYEEAARRVRALPVDVATLGDGELLHLDGIGPAMAGVIREHTATGSIGMLEEARKGEPTGFGALLRLPLIGVRDARTLAGTYGFTDVASLTEAVRRPGGLDGVDERLADRVRESLRRLAVAVDERIPLPLAHRDALALAEAFEAVDGVEAVVVAGDVRRATDTVGSFDLVVAGERPDEMAQRAAGARAVVRVLRTEPRCLTVLSATGRATRLWIASESEMGAALLFATGSRTHVAELEVRAERAALELAVDGLRRSGRRVAGHVESDVYAALGLPFVPPELREGTGEIAAAATDGLPQLVTAADLRGDLHVHSDWSGDGKASLDEMLVAADRRGHTYVAVTDHAENLKINGMSRDAVRARRRTIAELRERHAPLRILDAAELNIALDGSIDYDLEFLLEFDVSVASIHSHMDRPTPAQTDRILAAIAHPAVAVIGHPTGRILGFRPPYGIEIEAIAQAAAETGTALEVNGSPRRLDLRGEMVHAALRAGARIALSSDAHSVRELDYVANAVATARRGWATPSDVVNCLDADAFGEWVAAKRTRTG